MKKFLLSLAALLGFAPAFAGTGTEADPYTVAEILAMDLDNTNIASAYVKGYIVGSLKNGSFTDKNASFTADGAEASNIMIADDASCTDLNLVAAVQLVKETKIRTALNLVDNPGNLGKQLTIAGKVTKYCGHMGIKSPTAFTLGEGGGTTPDDPVTPPAQGALYSETFASGMGDFTTENVTLPEGLSYIFKADTQYGNIQASAYASGKNYASEAYLVSPVFDATKAAKLTAKFDQALNFFASIDAAKTEATIVARVEGGEWQTLTIPTYPENTDWTFVNTGDIDLAAFDGKKFQIAFRYTSTDTKAGTWRIKNFEINGEGTLGNDAKVTNPVFTPAAGVIFAGTPVTITCATEGADIHYTIDGTEPTAESTLYTEPIVINEATTVKAIAVKDGMEASSVVTAEYTIFTYEPSGFLGEFNTFNLGRTNTKYGTYKNATGWTAENCAIVSGNDTPDANENPQYAFIGDAKTLAPVLNGKTSATGKLTSPVLENGIKDLTFNCGLPYSDTKISLTVNIYDEDGTTLVKTAKVAPETVAKQTAYDFNLADINHTGKFVIEIVNNCPSDATSNKDRTAIWNLTWTAYSSAIDAVEAAEADAPAEFYNLQGVRVAAPANGIFIRRQGTKVEKVVIR